MSAQDWYARRLSPGQPQQQRPNYGPQPYQGPPQGYQGPAPQGYQQPVPQYQQPAGQQQFGPPPEQHLGKGSVNGWNLPEMMARWRGGAAHKVDKHPCPECNSPFYFSRSTGGPSRMMTGNAAPAPHCFSCGYSGGLFTQGDPATWGAA